MTKGLNVIIVDDDEAVCEILALIIERFYTWGQVQTFTDFEAAKTHCLSQPAGVAIFVLDVYIGDKTAFAFLEAVAERFPMAYQDAVLITGDASDKVVDLCVALDITHLLEKPVRPYALQLAVRAIVSKYMKFAKRLLQDPSFAEALPLS
ncbi:MAG: response regulator [Syntrophobacteraceae bacterium]